MAKLGQMNERLTLVGTTKVDNGRGGWTETDTPAVTVWAAIIQQSAAEVIRFNSEDTKIKTKIQTRYHPDIQQGVEYKGTTPEGRTFEMGAAIERNKAPRGYEFVAEEVF